MAVCAAWEIGLARPGGSRPDGFAQTGRCKGLCNSWEAKSEAASLITIWNLSFQQTGRKGLAGLETSAVQREAKAGVVSLIVIRDPPPRQRNARVGGEAVLGGVERA